MNTEKRLGEMLRNVLDAILERSGKAPDYGLINTKLSIVTGKDFCENDPWYTRKDIIYPWIQGRGLEAMAVHLMQLKSFDADTPARRKALKKLLRSTADKMEKYRRRNHGRLFFLMDLSGQFLQIGTDGCPAPVNAIPEGANYSDLFYSKGLWMAGIALKNSKMALRGERYFRRVVRFILNGHFITDQQAFDPKNPVKAVPGKHLQGPLMIALSGTAVGLKYGDSIYWERTALRLLKKIFSKHVDLKTLEFWEAVDDNGKPWIEQGKLLSDPGHNLELIGLSLKNLMQFKTPEGMKFADKCKGGYANFFRAACQRGFAPGPGGIVKSFDLIGKKIINSDMPWWSLPEGIRAALLCSEFTGDRSLRKTADTFIRIFLTKYVRPNRHDMAIQTRDARGKDIPVIPATPDADAGYHTGLSIIESLPFLREE